MLSPRLYIWITTNNNIVIKKMIMNSKKVAEKFKHVGTPLLPTQAYAFISKFSSWTSIVGDSIPQRRKMTNGENHYFNTNKTYV